MRLPGQYEEVDAWLCGYAAFVLGQATLIDSIELQPAVVDAEAGGANDRGHACFDEIEFKQRVGEAIGVCAEIARLWLFRQADSGARDVGGGCVEGREVVPVASADVLV